jgi:SDR family mycofactocin-dependent oxidoreductase
MGRVEGKVALITGAARGQGRSHARRLAEEGADIAALDIVSGFETVQYPPATDRDLDETAALVRQVGRKVIALRCDVRDQAALDTAVHEVVATFGHIDIVCANAGITTLGRTWEISDAAWDEVIAVNMTGVWRTLRATIPPLIAAERGGSIVITGSLAGGDGIGMPGLAHYVASKHAVVGLMRALANEVAEHNIRVNVVNPTNVGTDMLLHDSVYAAFRPDLSHPTQADTVPAFQSYHLLAIPWIDPIDVSNAVLWLASDEARYVTGVVLPIDAGASVKFPS